MDPCIDIPTIIAFVDHCIEALCRGLRSLGTYTRVAGEQIYIGSIYDAIVDTDIIARSADYVENLEQDYIPLERTTALNTIMLAH